MASSSAFAALFFYGFTLLQVVCCEFCSTSCAGFFSAFINLAYCFQFYLLSFFKTSVYLFGFFFRFRTQSLLYRFIVHVLDAFIFYWTVRLRSEYASRLQQLVRSRTVACVVSLLLPREELITI